MILYYLIVQPQRHHSYHDALPTLLLRCYDTATKPPQHYYNTAIIKSLTSPQGVEKIAVPSLPSVAISKADKTGKTKEGEGVKGVRAMETSSKGEEEGTAGSIHTLSGGDGGGGGWGGVFELLLRHADDSTSTDSNANTTILAKSRQKVFLKLQFSGIGLVYALLALYGVVLALR
jgi:hypothetical protein